MTAKTAASPTATTSSTRVSRRKSSPATAAAERTPPPLPARARRRPAAAVAPLDALQADLGGLRTALDEILARVRSRLIARLERVEQAAASNPPLAAASIEDMRDEIRRAQVSPKKGRMKDLMRLKRLLDELVKDLPVAG